jgi:hypothetical protein
MPRITSRRSPRRRRSQAAKLDFAVPVTVQEEKPVRGVKLKTVSAFTMLFALLCLFAFMAGRVDVAATNQPPKTAKARRSISKAGHKHAVAGPAKSGTPRQRAVQASF